MENLITCNRCGAQNRVGEIPIGNRVVCGNCRNVLGEVEGLLPKKKKFKIGSTMFAWIAIFAICIIAWVSNIPRSAPKKEGPWTFSPSRGSTRNDLQDFSRKTLPPRDSVPSRPIFSEPKQALPPHGEITWFSDGNPIAPLEIRSSSGANYYVKLSDYYSGRDVLSVFIHGGSFVTLDVPIGVYAIKYASGESWYGSKHLFGPETSYSKADASFNFQKTGNQISGYTLTLYRVVNGNLSTSPIGADEF